jgi:endoglycosylceramidase
MAMRLAAKPTLVPAAAVALLLMGGPAAAQAPELAPLHATRGDDPGVFDRGGREVLLRGVNVNQLGDYYQANTSLRPVVPLAERDLDGIAAMGFNSVRLLVHWSSLEPAPGEFDQAFVAKVRQAVDGARERGLYVVLDMHQDAWGKYIASPPDETCAPGFTPALGWDGAPEWATITDGLPRCKIQLREGSPAQRNAWTSFYADREGIQSALVRTWARLVREFAADPAVAGYDLLNEPNPGWGIGVDETAALGAFYGRAIEAIRAAEKEVPGGFSHIVFFEPGGLWSALGVFQTPPPTFTADTNIVFAPHLYSGSITALPSPSIEEGFDYAETAAAQYGVTVWSGEWGWFGDAAEQKGDIARYAREEDSHLFGGAWWQWRQACGDPHNFSVTGGQPGETSGNINRYRCPGETELGTPDSTRRILGRATVRAAPGRIVRLESDPDSGAFSMAGSDRAGGGSCELLVWLPGDFGVPQLRGRNVANIEARRYAGGWLATACASGSYELRTEGFIPEPGGGGPVARGRGCLARRAPIGPRNVGRVRLGDTRQMALRRVRPGPSVATPFAWRWCVKGSKGHVTAVFSTRSSPRQRARAPRGRIRLVVTTAPRHRLRGVGRGASERSLGRRFPRRAAIRPGVYRAGPGSRRLFGIRGARVRYAGVASGSLIRQPRLLRQHLKRAGV